MKMFLLQLRNELWKLFGKKRTYIGFAMFLIAQNLVCVIFKFTRAPRGMERLLEGNGYLPAEFISALTISTITLLPIAGILLPLYASLVGGDLLAKEAEDGTLRMILARPISRVRLLILKWLSGAVFSLVLVTALGTLGLIFARIWFPWGGLFVWLPRENIFNVLDSITGLQRYSAAHLMLMVHGVSILGVAFMFSCFKIKPAAATILGLSFYFVTYILMLIPYFNEMEAWFFAYQVQTCWQLMFIDPVPWARVGQLLSILLGYNLTFLLVGIVAFQVRDIKS